MVTIVWVTECQSTNFGCGCQLEVRAWSAPQTFSFSIILDTRNTIILVLRTYIMIYSCYGQHFNHQVWPSDFLELCYSLLVTIVQVLLPTLIIKIMIMTLLLLIFITIIIIVITLQMFSFFFPSWWQELPMPPSIASSRCPSSLLTITS